YREGNCTPEELGHLKQLFDGNELDELNRMLEDDWHGDVTDIPEDELLAKGRIWDRLRMQQAKSGLPAQEHQMLQPPEKRGWRREWMTVAAAVAGLVAGVLYYSKPVVTAIS